jgi:Fic/DOC family
MNMNGSLRRTASVFRGGSVPPPGSRADRLDVLETRLRVALDREAVDLGSLAAIVSVTAAGEIATIVRRKPAGVFARRLWYLYEWLTREKLDVPEPVGRLRFVRVLDPNAQVALTVGTPSGRHRVIDNLPGTRRFCPMVRWTPGLRTASAKGWDVRARGIIAATHPDRRPSVAAWLQRSAARSSFMLAGEKPSGLRAARWAQAIGQAGARVLTLDELLRLQRVACRDRSSARLGLRLGARGSPYDCEDRLGDHAGARVDDLDGLVGGVIDYAGRVVRAGVDPVIAAAAVAFGFGYIRPFAIGNGHLQRWLIHHIFDAAGYTPPGFVLPISSALIRRHEEYRGVLRSYSTAQIPFPKRTAGPHTDVVPRRETADAYRFVDMTRHAEFLYRCLEDSIEKDLRTCAR